MDGGHSPTEPFALCRQIDEHFTTVGLSMVATDEAGLGESPDDAVARTVGDKQPVREFAHTYRRAVLVDLVEDVVVVE